MLDLTWSHNRPTYRMTVTLNWYWTRTIPKCDLYSIWITAACHYTRHNYIVLTTKVSQNNANSVYESDDSQASTDESCYSKNDNRFSELEMRIDMLQNIFLNPFSTNVPLRHLLKTSENLLTKIIIHCFFSVK